MRRLLSLTGRLLPTLRCLLLLALGVSILVSAVEPAVAPPSVAPSPAWVAASNPAAIQTLLRESCQRCHGPTRQKGGLRIDSRDALLSGGKSGAAIILHDAAHSRLMQAVRYDDPDLQMPPDHRLSDRQIAALAEWISAGAPWDDAAAAALTTSSTTAPAVGPVITATATAPAHATRAPLIGRIHPLVVHFPIACLLIAVLAEFLRVTRGPRWEPAVRLLITLGMLGAMAAVVTGTWFAPEGSLFQRTDATLGLHEFAGWMTMILATISWTLLQLEQRPRIRQLFRLTLLLAAVLSGLAGHLGGTMTYGPHWLF